MTEVPKPLDAALDLFLYAPVGLALTAAEELPKLAAKGRTRVNTQLMMAKVVGQFAVSRGRQELEKRFTPPTPSASAGSPASPAASIAVEDPEMEPPVTFDEMTATNGSGPGLPGADHSEGDGDVSVSVAGDLATVTELPRSTPSAPSAPRVPSGPAPSADELAIPGYDSLSASQVVQRLAGLSGQELVAVAAYERAHRGRRTILNRIDQLQGQ